jgi:hypothetical protein
MPRARVRDACGRAVSKSREIGVIVVEAETGGGVEPKRVASFPIRSRCSRAPMLAALPMDRRVLRGVRSASAIRAALPAALTSHETPAPAQRTRRVVSLRRDLPSLIHRDRIFAARHSSAHSSSSSNRSAVRHRHLLDERLNCSASVLKALTRAGW